jgi:hypothetical protein
MKFRKLKPSEIETRPQNVKENGAMLLLYKDARADMKILDETVGETNWKREHRVVNGNLFCTVSIYDDEKEQWVSKEDVGVESNTEKEKGQASDSFKRACVNWGIGRELYTSPFIWVNLKSGETYKSGKSVRLQSKVNFEVSKIDYNDDGEISDLEIVDQDGNLRWKMGEYIAADNGKSNKKSSSSKKTEDTISDKTVANIKDWLEDESAKKIIVSKLKEKGFKGWNGLYKLTEKEGKELLEDINSKQSA